MENIDIRFTSRMQRIIRNAEREALQSKAGIVKSAHLLIACLYEKGGALGDLILHTDISLNSIRDTAELTNAYQTMKVDYFDCLITVEVAKVTDVAVNYMNHYNQIFVNEGHLLKALITTKALDSYLSRKTREIILRLGTTSRDMFTHLGNYTFPVINTKGIRKVRLEDEEIFVAFVKENFSQEWASTIKSAFMLIEPSIYVALDENEKFIGFAAYDIYQNKKGYFGPMGVVTSNRANRAGYALLHHCLKDMKEVGYEYAIIGGAGPIEFYEKACNAVVIPSVSVAN